MLFLNQYITTFITIFIMGFASLFAQKSEINRRQLMADSIAKRVTFDYNADTLYSELTQEIGYLKSKEIYTFQVNLRDDKWEDSSWTFTNYDLRGERLTLESVEKSPIDCPQPIPTSFNEYSLYPMGLPMTIWYDGETKKERRKLRKMAEKPIEVVDSICTSSYVRKTIFNYNLNLDISNGIAIYDDDTTLVIDSTFYYPNKLKQRTVSYVKGKFERENRFRYQYDTFGTLAATEHVDSTNNALVHRVSHFNYHDKDTVLIFMSTLVNGDSSKFTEGYWIYNNAHKQIGFQNKTKGKITHFLVLSYDSLGNILASKTFKADSTLQSENLYARKIKKNRSEVWVYQSSFQNYYGLTITKTRKGKKYSYGYNAILQGKFDDFKYKKPKKIHKSQFLVYDEHGRILVNQNFDGEKDQLISETRFYYSK
jgi:hypothetical protein